MNQRKFSRLEFVMEFWLLLLNIVGLVSFFVITLQDITNSKEMNSPMILSFFLVGIGTKSSASSAVKWGDKMSTRFLTFAITALLVAGAILLIGDRVEGIGNCIVTDDDSGHAARKQSITHWQLPEQCFWE